MRVIADVMGSDKGVRELVRGCCDAATEYGCDITLVGDSAAIKAALADCGADAEKFEIVHADDVMTMNDDPLSVTRAKSGSSMSVALRLLADGAADAMVSAGNTGALFTGATLIVRKIKGVNRPALATVLPMKPPVLLLDSGANVNVVPKYFEQFAIMGSEYMRKIHGVECPRVGLLNNGEERCKGTELQQQAYGLLEALDGINFIGNVEGNKIPQDVCDVLVTDGFTGNILLKNIEGMGKLMMSTLRDMYKANTLAKLSALCVKNGLRRIKKDFDASEYGGAPLLGISKPVIKAHGSSDARAFKNAIRQARLYVESGLIAEITDKSDTIFAKKKTDEKNGENEPALKTCKE